MNDTVHTPVRKGEKKPSTKKTAPADTPPTAIETALHPNFRAGVDLAVALIRAGEETYDGPNCNLLEARRHLRDGRPQLRFATPYLQQLIDQPALLEGFSAVLTQELGTPGECLGSEFHRAMDYNEYLPGVPGENGTITNPEDQPRDTEQVPAITSVEVEQDITWETRLPDGGQPALDLMMSCTFDIDRIAEDATESANTRRGAATVEEASAASLARMQFGRIKALNSLLMSYLGDDNVDLAHAHRVIYGRRPEAGEQP